MTTETSRRAHPKLILLFALVAALVVGAAVVRFIDLARDQDDAGPVAAGPDACRTNHGRPLTIVYFDGPDADAHMQSAADALRGDAEVAAIDTETRQRAFERFKEIFKDQPELVRLARPEALPASVRVVPARGIQADAFSARLRTKLPEADQITPDICRLAAPRPS